MYLYVFISFVYRRIRRHSELYLHLGHNLRLSLKWFTFSWKETSKDYAIL